MAIRLSYSKVDNGDEYTSSCSDRDSDVAYFDDNGENEFDAGLKRWNFEEFQKDRMVACSSKTIANKFKRRKKHVVAYHHFTAALETLPVNPILFLCRSTCQFSKKLFFESFDDACIAIDLDPLQDRGFQNLIQVLIYFGLAKLATKVANIALEFDKANRQVFVKWINEDYLNSSLKSDVEEEATEYFDKFNRRLTELEQKPNFNSIREINREFEINKNYGRVFKLCQELLFNDIPVPSAANAYYYTSLCYHYLYEKEMALSTVNMCLYLAEYHSPAYRLKENISKFYSYRDHGFLSFVKGKYNDCMNWYRKGSTLNNNTCYNSVPFDFVMELSRKAQTIYKPVELFKIEQNMDELPSNTDIDKSFFIKAEAFVRAGRLEMAAEFYKLAFMSDPGDYQIVSKCSEALMKIGKFQEVLNLIRKVRELNSDCGFARIEEGNCLLALGKVNKAIKVIERANKLLPEENEVKLVLARALTLKEFLKKSKKLMENDHFAVAEIYLTNAREIAYKDENLISLIIKCKNKMSDLKDMTMEADRSYADGIFEYCKLNISGALDHFKKALQHDPSHAPSRAGIKLVTNVFETNNVATICLAKGSYETAFKLFKRGLSLDETNARAQGMFHYGLGDTYFQLKNYQYAAIEFTKALSCNDEDANAYEMRGRCNGYLHRFREATEDFLCALDIDPKNDNFRYLHSKSKEREKLLEELDQFELPLGRNK